VGVGAGVGSVAGVTESLGVMKGRAAVGYAFHGET
jgi:hypothetical protein